MRAFQCSKCKSLEDNDEYVSCSAIGDIRPNRRDIGAKAKCLQNFVELKQEEIWHSEFSWEANK